MRVKLTGEDAILLGGCMLSLTAIGLLIWFVVDIIKRNF